MGVRVWDRAQHREHGQIMESQLQERLRGSCTECSIGYEELQAESRLPCGWEKCLDLKTGLIYFKDWNSGTLTYRDPRQAPQAASQRVGLLAISLSDQEPSPKKRKTIPQPEAGHRFATPATANTRPDNYSLELSLHLPGTGTPSGASWPGKSTTQNESESRSQDGSVCTMEKVRSALERSQWLSPASTQKRKTKTTTKSERKRGSSVCNGAAPCGSHPTVLSLGTTSRSESVATTSPCSSERVSECFTSPSVMSFQGDDEEVQQPGGDSRDSSGANIRHPGGNEPQLIDSVVSPVMVTVGCKSCLMYVMLSKSHPSCPKCGSTDVLLVLPVASPKKRRTVDSTGEIGSSPRSWSWCTA